MPRTWSAIAALVVVSLVGDFYCRIQASSINRTKLMAQAGSRVKQLPDQIGHWHVARSEPLDDKVVRILQCRAHENRVYVNDENGETVSLVLLAGPPGPLIAHTPEVCYSSVAYATLETASPGNIPSNGDDVFSRVTVRELTVTGDTERIYYAWRKAQGHWVAPNSPRLTLGGQPMLYKLQVVGKAPVAQEQDGDQPPPDSDPARSFLIELLPVLEKSLSIPLD
jgi:hypothetical protein